MKKTIGSGVLAALALFTLPAVAQMPSADPTPGTTFRREVNTYGTQGETVYTIPTQAFSVQDPTMTWVVNNDYSKYVTNNGGCCLEAPVFLPAGALITAVELLGCDNSMTGALNGVLMKCFVPAQPCFAATLGAGSGISDSQGCGFFRRDAMPPETIDNAGATYYFAVANAGDVSGLVSLRAARIHYKLQISPDPATARFADVPVGHPLHRFVEALAAAGITSGCGGGNYCPDAPVTRGQMAVFLSAALGLHWAP